MINKTLTWLPKVRVLKAVARALCLKRIYIVLKPTEALAKSIL